jgi:DNA-binding transcriptional LysR family regulator
MNYTLNQLQIFLKIVKTQSITKASEEMYLTQPAVSIQLKNFQDQFEIPLTEVIGRKIHITDFGYEIAKAAENILEQVHAINYKTLAFKGLLTGKLKISIVSTGIYIMPFFLSEFIKQHPGIELIMEVTNKTTVLESLEKNDVDFALVSILPKHFKVDKIDILKNKMYMVGNTDKTFGKNVNTKELFKDLPLIFREKGSAIRQTMDQFIEKHQIDVPKQMELTSNEAVKQALLAGLGYSVMPLIGLKNELINNELQIIPVKGLPINSNWSLIWQKNKKHSPITSALIEFIKLRKDQIVEEKFSWYDQFI